MYYVKNYLIKWIKNNNKIVLGNGKKFHYWEIKNSFCDIYDDDKCKCSDGFVPSINKTSCYKIIDNIGDECEITEQCQKISSASPAPVAVPAVVVVRLFFVGIRVKFWFSNISSIPQGNDERWWNVRNVFRLRGNFSNLLTLLSLLLFLI